MDFMTQRELELYESLQKLERAIEEERRNHKLSEENWKLVIDEQRSEIDRLNLLVRTLRATLS